MQPSLDFVIIVLLILLNIACFSLPSTDWALECHNQDRKEYSQAGQDGILECIVKCIGTAIEESRNEDITELGFDGTYVEFGFNSESFEGGSGSNSYWLYKSRRWKGLLLDGQYSNSSINLHAVWITESNICEIFMSHGLGQYDIDYLSIDIDSIDYWILQSILSCGYRPRVISVEYNSNFPMDSYLSVTRDAKFQLGNRLYGASFGAYKFLCQIHGYTVVAVAKYLDIFFVRTDLLKASKVRNFLASEVEGETHEPLTSRPDVENSVIDVSVLYHSRGNITKAKQAAIRQDKALSNLYKRFLYVAVLVQDRVEYFTYSYELLGTDIGSLAGQSLIRSEAEITVDFLTQLEKFCSKFLISQVIKDFY